ASHLYFIHILLFWSACYFNLALYSAASNPRIIPAPLSMTGRLITLVFSCIKSLADVASATVRCTSGDSCRHVVPRLLTNGSQPTCCSHASSLVKETPSFLKSWNV